MPHAFYLIAFSLPHCHKFLPIKLQRRKRAKSWCFVVWRSTARAQSEQAALQREQPHIYSTLPRPAWAKSCGWCPCSILKGLPRPPTRWRSPVFPTARKALGSGGTRSPKCPKSPGAQARPVCRGATRMDGPQLAGCPSPTLYQLTEQRPDVSAENCLHKVTSMHTNQLLFSGKQILVPIIHKRQLHGTSYANIVCIWTLDKATHGISVQRTLIHTRWHCVISQNGLQEQDLCFTANMIRLFIQSCAVVTVEKAWQHQSWSQF